MTDKEIIAGLREALINANKAASVIDDPIFATDDIRSITLLGIKEDTEEALEKYGSDHVVDTNKMIDEKPSSWDELFNFLNKNTSPKGTWHIDFNEHRTSYHSFEQDIANYNLDPEDFVDGFDSKKDIYCLRWYRESPHGSTWLYFNTPKQALSALLGEGGEK